MPNADPNITIVFDNMVAEWGNTTYAPLSILLVHLRFLAMVHQTHHWTCRGDSFYGDHQLFQRLYDEVQQSIDNLAERLVGLGSVDGVSINLQTTQLSRLVSGYGMMSTIPQPTELTKRSLAATCNFIKTAEVAMDCLKEHGALTYGLENMIAGIMDNAETHVYLLKQRTTV